MNLLKLLSEAVEKDASDIHLKFGKRPVLRVKQEIIELKDEEILDDNILEEFISQIMSPVQKTKFLSQMDMDLAYELENISRFRVNIFRQRGHIGIVMRRIKSYIPSFEELSLPPVLKKISGFHDGFILVTGPTGCGKSTTLASIIDYIDINQSKHIVTIEDPIEYIYKDKNSIIDQREVGLDTLSFNAALKHVLREDPDIILIGELRDVETFESAVRSSETGHLVFGTLHTTDTLTTITRILDFFPQSQHDQVRKVIAYNLKSTVCQRLVPRKDGNGVVPVCEIMVVTPIISRLIVENKINKIYGAIVGGKEEGMQSFNQHLVQLIQADTITKETGFTVSPAPDALEMNLRGIYLDEETRIIGE
ncbi:MAG: PilT/PilU family type 4a pilus ATPase [Candidatus Omnitrophica bacterium]|nr:PilT/PilU family type 4a pilus ATPase [Candidatus Omnitrophota bacterium]